MVSAGRHINPLVSARAVCCAARGAASQMGESLKTNSQTAELPAYLPRSSVTTTLSRCDGFPRLAQAQILRLRDPRPERCLPRSRSL